jgi:hypothetical protein
MIDEGNAAGEAPHVESAWLMQACTTALAASLHRYLQELQRLHLRPDLPLLRATAAALHARPDRGPTENQALGNLQEWLEWDAPRFDLEPGSREPHAHAWWRSD